ncbi:MAG: SRPBCC family protein [Candidatus Sericytochromatia bacterium]
MTNNTFADTVDSKIKRGEIVIEDYVDSNAKSGTAKMTFMINDTPERIWKLLIEYDRWTSFMQDLEKIVIKEKKDNYAIVYVKAKAPLGMDISYTLKRIYKKENYKITWTMLEGKAKEIEGSWQIVPIGNKKCKVIYTNYVDLGFMVPPKITNMLTKNKLPNLAEGIKGYLKKNRDF